MPDRPPGGPSVPLARSGNAAVSWPAWLAERPAVTAQNAAKCWGHAKCWGQVLYCNILGGRGYQLGIDNPSNATYSTRKHRVRSPILHRRPVKRYTRVSHVVRSPNLQIHPQVQVEFDPDFSFPPRVKPRSLARSSARLLQAKGIKHRHPRRLKILHIARHHRQVMRQRDGSDQVINPLTRLRAQPPPQLGNCRGHWQDERGKLQVHQRQPLCKLRDKIRCHAALFFNTRFNGCCAARIHHP